MNRKVRVWFGQGGHWWRWACPCCPKIVGGFCLSQRAAYAAGLQHALREHPAIAVAGR